MTNVVDRSFLDSSTSDLAIKYLIHTSSRPHKVSVCTDLTSPNRFVIDLPPNIDEVNGRARPSTVCHAVAIVQPAPARTLSSSFSLSRALKYMIKYIFASERRVHVHRYSSGMHEHQTFERLPCHEAYPEQAQALTHCPHTHSAALPLPILLLLLLLPHCRNDRPALPSDLLYVTPVYCRSQQTCFGLVVEQHHFLGC